MVLRIGLEKKFIYFCIFRIFNYLRLNVFWGEKKKKSFKNFQKARDKFRAKAEECKQHRFLSWEMNFRYTSNELKYFPLNTVLYGPVRPNERHFALPGGSDGSQSEIDDSSSSDDSR